MSSPALGQERGWKPQQGRGGRHQKEQGKNRQKPKRGWVPASPVGKSPQRAAVSMYESASQSGRQGRGIGIGIVSIVSSFVFPLLPVCLRSRDARQWWWTDGWPASAAVSSFVFFFFPKSPTSIECAFDVCSHVPRLISISRPKAHPQLREAILFEGRPEPIYGLDG